MPNAAPVEGVIRQMRLPYTLHALRIAFRSSLVAAHSLPVIPIAFLVFGQVPGPEAFLAIFGLLLIGISILGHGLIIPQANPDASEFGHG